MGVKRGGRARWHTPWLAALIGGAPAASGLLSAAPARGQVIELVTLSGTIVDAQSKAPIVEAAVSVISPALQTDRVVVTDESGSYSISNLPPGDYTLSVYDERYHGYSRGGIALRAGGAGLDVELLRKPPVEFECDLPTHVSNPPPTVDVGSTASGLIVGADHLQRLPLAPPAGKGGAGSSFESLSELAPLGGGDLYGASVAGATSFDNGYAVDGVSVADAFGLAGSPVALEFVKEVNLATGGYLPEYGRSQGGVFDVVTKSGSNDAHGSVFTDVTPIVANPKSARRRGAAAGAHEPANARAFGATLGGPIVKDGLWFFAGFQAADTTYARLHDGERATSTQHQGMVKVDLRLDKNNTITASGRTVVGRSGGEGYFAAPQAGGLGPFGAAPAGDREPQRHDLLLKWSNLSQNSHLLFNTTVGSHVETDVGFVRRANLYRTHAREVVTYLIEGLGHHVAKVGAEVAYEQVGDAAPFAGGAYSARSLWAGAFAQDSWAILDIITLNAGLRYDTQAIYNGQGDVALALPNQFAPRLGLIYDPTQKGQSKLFTSFGVYYQGVPTGLVGGGTGSPGRRFSSAGPPLVDPDLKPPSSSEFQAGGEYEIVSRGHVGVTYVHKWANAVVAPMGRDGSAAYFVGNPGEGAAKDFSKAERVYDAGVVYFTKVFADGWLSQASYTLSYLRGDRGGYFGPALGGVDQGANVDVAPSPGDTGPLPADRRHELKFFFAKDWQFGERHRLTLGAGYRARSGGPANVLGGNVAYGPAETFAPPRGEGDRLSWAHDLNLRLAYAFLRTPDESLKFTVDAFNLFNAQAAAAVDETYAYAGGAEGRHVVRPVTYQAPLQVRFGVRMTF